MKTIIISAINFRSGGPLSILNDCLQHLSQHWASNYRIIALVHNKKISKPISNIHYVPFPNSTKSYVHRVFYEYFYFKKISLQYKPDLWLSLHDISPFVIASRQAVYCHNPAPFYELSLKEISLDPKFAIFNFFYRWVYRINIKSNKYVIVQQEWLRKKFIKLYKLHHKNVVVAYPQTKSLQGSKSCNTKYQKQLFTNQKIKFFFPAFPRVFKNFEILGEATKILLHQHPNLESKFEIILTIDGTENRYSKWIHNKYNKLKVLNFIGLISRSDVFKLYEDVHCLIFPSKLETWGLPITEFKNFDKPILVADLDYAHETIGQYNQIKFFDPNSAKMLAKAMRQIIENKITFDAHKTDSPQMPHSSNWLELFKILIK